MKNIFRRVAAATPLDQKTQKYPDKYSPTVIQSGIGFGLAWITAKLGLTVFEIANTNSMLPTFDYDHLLYCEDVADARKKLNMYDVCIYEDLVTPSLIVHRIVGVDYVGQRYKFQGDNNLMADGWIPRDRIKYRVVVISYGR